MKVSRKNSHRILKEQQFLSNFGCSILGVGNQFISLPRVSITCLKVKRETDQLGLFHRTFQTLKTMSIYQYKGDSLLNGLDLELMQLAVRTDISNGVSVLEVREGRNSSSYPLLNLNSFPKLEACQTQTQPPYFVLVELLMPVT